MFFVCVCSIVGSPTHAQIKEHKKALSGLKGVSVIIEEFQPDFDIYELTTEQLQTDVELRLRKAGIKVGAIEKFPSSIYVNLNMRAVSACPGLYSYGLQIELQELVSLDRRPKVVLTGTLWSLGNSGTVGKDKAKTDLRELVADLVDRFINDYLAANPR